MRCYSPDVEQRIHAAAAVRSWKLARLIEKEQADRLLKDLHVDVRQTNEFFRAGLAVFAVLVVSALGALMESLLGLTSVLSMSALTLTLALGCVLGAEALIGGLKFYRHGVEEALVAASMVLIGLTAGFLFDALVSPAARNPRTFIAIGLAAAACAGLAAYVRYGYVFTALIGLACAASAPFNLSMTAEHSRMAAAALCAIAFVASRWKRNGAKDEWLVDEYAILQAASWLGLYWALNVQLGWDSITAGWFYWFTYVMTFVLPAAGLLAAVRGKDRALLNVGIVIAIATLVTNKPYLGWPRHEWDPVLLGVVLLAVVFWVRRWLSSAPGGQRRGFTADRVLSDRPAALTLLSAVPFGTAAHPPASHTETPSGFDGGRSGGGGADGAF